MHAISRVARESAGRIAVLTATSGAVSASRGTAQARPAPNVQRPELFTPTSHGCQEEWLITHVDAGNVLFHPEDIDAVASEVLALVPRQSTQQASRSDHTESDGHEATSVIESNDIGCVSISRETPVAGPYDLLTRVASELLKKPGVQQQVLDVILEDPELLAILCDNSNMNNYLTLWGVTSSGLLPPLPTVEDITDSQQEEDDETAQSCEASPLDQLVSHLLRSLGKMGDAMHQVGNWLKGLFRGNAQAAVDSSKEVHISRPAFFSAFTKNPFISAAVMLGMAMVCVLLLRRPQLLAALVRRKAVAAAAAVGVAAVAK